MGLFDETGDLGNIRSIKIAREKEPDLSRPPFVDFDTQHGFSFIKNRAELNSLYL
jgi:hypothetical protein